jgi:hypothetical protein
VSSLEFDIHGYATIRVKRGAPSAAILHEMFQPFSVEGLAACDLTVGDTASPMNNPAHAENHYRYTSNSVYLQAGRTQVTLDGAGAFYLGGKGELLTSTLPLLDIILARHGAAMIHAATFEYKGLGVALPAWGGTGKTSAMAKLLLGADEGSFMGDDWAFVAADGRLLGFAKPMFIKPHHRRVYPDLFKSKRKLMVPTALSGPIEKLATAAHPMVTRFPRVARLTRRWSPEHLIVRPDKAFDRVARSAPLGAVIFMERFSGADLMLEPQKPEWMAGRMIGNFYAEMPPYSREVLTALAATGLVPLPEPFAEKQALLTKVLSNKPVFLLRIPDSLPTHEASSHIATQVMKALALAGVA